ncbi:tyrosine-type recombinase/integrase [soil metagenome]
MTDAELLADFELHMMTLKRSPQTILNRLECVRRLAATLPVGLLEASPKDLQRWQESIADLSHNTMDIYSRHIVAFYAWAVVYGHLAAAPTNLMVRVGRRKGIPHPIRASELKLVLACSTGDLRLAYVLAAFAGLRCGEICRLRGEDLQLDAAQPTALIRGKGGRERRVPLLPPVVEALSGSRARGPVLLGPTGRAWSPNLLSVTSHHFMRSIGVESTLHSLRHYFATEVVKMTRDLLLVRDLLGHASLQTTQVYLLSSIDGAQEKLAGFSMGAAGLMSNN